MNLTSVLFVFCSSMTSNPDGSFPDDDVYGSDSGHEKEIRRGVSAIKKVILARSKCIRLPVGWNDRGQPINPNKSIFVGYIGVQVRQRVPIAMSNWRQVPSPIKKIFGMR